MTIYNKTKDVFAKMVKGQNVVIQPLGETNVSPKVGEFLVATCAKEITADYSKTKAGKPAKCASCAECKTEIERLNDEITRINKIVENYESNKKELLAKNENNEELKKEIVRLDKIVANYESNKKDLKAIAEKSAENKK